MIIAKDTDSVQIEMTPSEYSALAVILGYAAGAAMDKGDRDIANTAHALIRELKAKR